MTRSKAWDTGQVDHWLNQRKDKNYYYCNF
jgi:predicted DNA-binding transcriptional regulator AlpA